MHSVAACGRFPKLGFQGQRKVNSARFATSLLSSETARAWESVGEAAALAEAGVVDAKSVGPAVESLLTDGTDARRMHTVWDVLNLEVWLRSRL